MEDFFNKLYSYEFFGFYLIISIIVLVILFLIILFFGKKDQKNREKEATKKLQQINAEAFKEETSAEKLEVKEELLGDTIVVPRIEDVPTLNNVEANNDIPEPIIPESAIEVERLDVDDSIQDKVSEEVAEPILEKVEERPLAFENTNVIQNLGSETLQPTVEEITPVVEDSIVEVPEFNYEEVLKDTSSESSKGPQVFSSVYVPEKNDEVIPPVEKKDDEMDFELPALKKDTDMDKTGKIDMPALSNYNLDDLSGESYTIK